MNILHLSDIHFGRNYQRYGIPSSFDKHNQILDELLDMLKNLSDDMKPEHIVFTGDIAWYGKRDEYSEAAEWFKKLLSATGLTGQDISFCPGNHDVDLSRHSIDERLNDNMVERIDELYSYQNMMLSETRLHAYNEFCREIGVNPYIYPLNDKNHYSYSCGYKDVEFSCGKKIRFLSFNTSLLLGSGISEDRMWLGQPQLKELIENGILPSSDDIWYTIALFHHSERFLHPNETSSYDGRPATLTLLGSYADLLLCGHTESAGKPRLFKQKGGGTIFSAGATYYSDDHANSFASLYISDNKKAMAFFPYVYDEGWKEYDFSEKDFIEARQFLLSQNKVTQRNGTLVLESSNNEYHISLPLYHYEDNAINNEIDIMSPLRIHANSNGDLKIFMQERRKSSAEGILAYLNCKKWIEENYIDKKYKILNSDNQVIMVGNDFKLMEDISYDENFLYRLIKIENTFQVIFQLPEKIDKDNKKTFNLLSSLVDEGFSSRIHFSNEHIEMIDEKQLLSLYEHSKHENNFYLANQGSFKCTLFSTDVYFKNVYYISGSYSLDLDDLKHKIDTLCEGDQRSIKFIANKHKIDFIVRNPKAFWQRNLLPQDAYTIRVKKLEREINNTNKEDSMNNIKLNITSPSGEFPIVSYGRHFNVEGKIETNELIPDNALLTISLYDGSGNLLRHVKQDKKNNRNAYVNHPDLTSYSEQLDSGKEKLKDFGFAEILVKDVNDPMASFKDATIKCWYSDTDFRGVIITASDVKHGLTVDDGVNFLDENSNPYTLLEEGDYTIKVELSLDDKVLAETSKEITIQKNKNQAIVRFNPMSHRLKMIKWCQEKGLDIINDTLPGYLIPYLGVWYYHMGLLPMYRASDLSLYRYSHVHMFLYLIEEDSTSYETELAYLMTQNKVDNPNYFSAYHYDIGEAVVGEGKSFETKGNIVQFKDDEYLSVCRIDIVNDLAKENYLNLDYEAVDNTITDLNNIHVKAGNKIAIMGVVKPWQLDPKDFILRDNNTYEIKDSVSKIIYKIENNNEVINEERELLMERIDDKSICKSVYEFYNIFEIPKSLAGTKIKLSLIPKTRKGESKGIEKTITINVD